MNKNILFLLLMMSYQAIASESYNKMKDVIRQYMSTKQGMPHDLTEYGAKILLSKDDVFGDKEEILQLSDAGFRLFSSLTEEEKAKLPKILLATPGTFAMKFYSTNECCFRRFITQEQPTEDDLDRKSREVTFV